MLHCSQMIWSPLKADRLGFHGEFFSWFSNIFVSLEDGLLSRKKTIDFLDAMKLRN